MFNFLSLFINLIDLISGKIYKVPNIIFLMGDEERPYAEIPDDVLDRIYVDAIFGDSSLLSYVPDNIALGLERLAMFHALNGHQDGVVKNCDLIGV